MKFNFTKKKIIIIVSAAIVIPAGCILALFVWKKIWPLYKPANYQPVVAEATDSIGEIVNKEFSENPYNDMCNLCVPTYVDYVDGLYFIVDCYNDRVIYSEDFNAELLNWKVMTSGLYQPHTMASDGNVYLIDDTENNRVVVYKKSFDANGEVCFYESQIFENIGNRPHYIRYNEADATFYVWSSMSGELYLFEYMSESDLVVQKARKQIPELDGKYIRSFTIMGDDIYFVSNMVDSTIYQCDLNSLEIEKTYVVADELAGMVQITFCDGVVFVTVSTDRNSNTEAKDLIACESLDDLSEGKFTSYYTSYVKEGTPYNITLLSDGYYYLTIHCNRGVNQILRFSVENGVIVDENIFF